MCHLGDNWGDGERSVFGEYAVAFSWYNSLHLGSLPVSRSLFENKPLMINLEQKIRNSLKKVLDPELRINIVDLGLVYDVREENGEVEVEMTLTSPGCPLAGVIDARIKEVVGKIKGVKNITVEIIWDPPWTQEMMSDEAKAELGFD